MDAIGDELKNWMSSSLMTVSGKPGDEPLVVFHGTSARFDFDQMSPAAEGSLGAGFYFTRTREHASIYCREEGGIVMQAHLRMSNPYRYTMREGEHVDIWGEGLAIDVMGHDRAMALIGELQRTGRSFDARLTDAIKDLGHDGVIGDYCDGTMEIVVFDRSQIRDADPALAKRQQLAEEFDRIVEAAAVGGALDGAIRFPGVLGDVVGRRGAGLSILGWSGDGSGRTRHALASLRRFAGCIVVQDVGEPGEKSWAYWMKMRAEGLVDEIQDADGYALDERGYVPDHVRQGPHSACGVSRVLSARF